VDTWLLRRNKVASGISRRAAGSSSLSFRWILKTRWNSLTGEQQDDFSPICPDFVIELRSPADRIGALKRKMEEYRACGARLGWLLDPIANRAYIYRPDIPVQEIEKPDIICGDPILPGFNLDFLEIL
jgi:Uma2 family endonuclease